MPTSSVSGPLAIVSCSACGLKPIAAKVSAMLVNSWAWVSATGATWAEVRPSSRKKLGRSVSGAARLVMTGVR